MKKLLKIPALLFALMLIVSSCGNETKSEPKSEAKSDAETITDANFYQAIKTCLSTNPVDGMCSDSEYGAMPNWDVSQVTNMKGAFDQSSDFNADIRNWDVSSVTSMFGMFALATSFNQPIGDWNVSNVTNMEFMFYQAESFNQPIEDWDVDKVSSCNSFCDGASSWTLSKPDFTFCSGNLGCD